MAKRNNRPTPNKPPLLDDGRLRIRTVATDGTETTCSLDLLEAKLAAERVQERHKLQQKDGILAPTTEFLRDLIPALESVGAKNLTPSTAYQIWIRVGLRMAELQKKTFGTLK